MIIDAQDCVLGRVASLAAKKALLGENIIVINADKAYITGRKLVTIARYHDKFETGQIRKGPFLYKQPDRFVKRVIRGMLPHKQPRGREALKRVRCYPGVPEVYAAQKTITVKGASVSKLPNLRRISVGELCESIGGKR
ncbi:MAG: 50S ribosomal protein L13 [Nanoarchaeota archaeon]